MRDRYAKRHRDLPGVLRANYARIAHRVPADAELSDERRSLVGAWFTHEYSVEAAALFNPSVVVHPDQSGLLPGRLRFILSLRAVGEGHLSSVEFRTGVLGPAGELRIDEPGPHIERGRTLPTWYDRAAFAAALAGQDIDRESAAFVIARLAPRFRDDELEAALADLAGERLTRPTAARTADLARRIAACSYEVEFPPETTLAERVLWPQSPCESHGIEDARFVRVEDDGVYRATYTAFDGAVDRPAADRDHRLPSLPHLPARRAGRAEQGHGPVPASGRRPLRRPLPLGPGEQRHRHVRRRGLVGRRPHAADAEPSVGAAPARQLRFARSRPRPAGSC